MKKKYLIQGLMIVGLIGIVGFQSPLVLAEEQNKSIEISDETEATDEMIPTTIEILSEETTLEVNGNLALTAKIISESNIKTAIWTTSNETIATISNTGIVTGKKAGTVSITASTSNKKSASISLTVTEKKEAVTGTYGTVPWTWEAETQTLSFGEGNFPPSDWVNGILYKIENLTRLEGKKIKKILFTKPVVANQSSDYLFFELRELESIEGLELLNTSNVSGMAYMFGTAFGKGNKLSTIDVSNWDTSKVTNMSYMFASASSLTTLDVSKWDTSKVTNMFAMFRDASSLTALDTSKWNTSKVTNMADMFRDASSLTTINTDKWDTGNVTDMSNMFDYTKCLTTLDVSSWDTRNVTNMSYMFAYARNLTAIDVSKFDTSNVTNMAYMFYDTPNLITLDVSKFNTSNVTNTSYMFGGTKKLTALDVSKFDTSKVTDMQFMFGTAQSLTMLDVSKFDTSNVTNMAYMFYCTNNLMTVDVSMWDTSNVTNMGHIFYDARILTKADVSMWDTTNVTNMAFTFAYARNLRTIDVSNWDTSKVSSMTQMFYDTRNLTEVDLSKWDTSKVARMDQAFAFTNSLSTLILGENTLNLLKEASFPEKKNSTYTGKWALISPDIQNSYSSSEDLMANYDGTKPGKYVREKIGDSTKVTEIELTPPTVELTVSEEATLQAKITPATASNKKVSYTTSDNSVATVSTNGVVKGIKKGTAVITATAEDGNFQATSTVTVVDQSAFLIDLFYLGIDSYVTGSVDTSLSAKKVQLVINGEVITTSTIFGDGSFELDTEGMITKITDKVEVVALDRKNKELERATVTIEEKFYALSVNPYTLYEDSTVTGKTDYFHTHVALVINGEEIKRKLLSSTRQFSFDVESLIDYADDEVEVVGYRYEEEITRKDITIQEPVIEMVLTPYKVDEPYVTGKVTGKSAKNVRLYVNGRRQQTIKVAEDGTFNLLGVAILSPKDKVQLAVLNDAGIEIQRFSVEVTN